MSKKNYRLDEGLIDVYFQKSYKFLFPLLKIRIDVAQPAQVYISWLDIIKKEDYKLIVVYDLREDADYKSFEKGSLFANTYFTDFKVLEGNVGAYIFTMHAFKEDVDHFYQGRYSLFSETSKSTLLSFYNVNEYSREYMDSYLNPGKYLSKYAKLLNVSDEVIRASGELCNKYDKNKERLHLKEVTLNLKNDVEI